MVKDTDTCGGCAHMARQGGGFACLRYPPTVFIQPATDPVTKQTGMVSMGYYPPVSPSNRACGEFEGGNRVAVAQTLPKLSIAV